MPYSTISELPDNVKNHLPKEAQEIFKTTFNNAFNTYKADKDRETIANKVAWSAVKHKYEKDDDGKWIKK